MFNKVLIANRGEIACRIIKAAKELGIETVAIYSHADKHALHVRQANQAFYVGESVVADSYLNQQKIIQIAKENNVEAIHPGYGLLAENADFAQACENASLVFIGPKSATIAKLADKAEAKDLAQSLSISVIDSIAVPANITDQWIDSLDLEHTYIIKACAGGGGKGMRLIDHNTQDIKTTIELAKQEARNYFANDAIILEQYIKPARHIEVQILADQQGNIIHLFDRDCSLQRRYQKIIEEAPAPNIDLHVREQMYAAAIKLSKSVNYSNAGTVEFLLDEHQNFYFLEMNTRVQVEHCVTEMITHQDIVKRQFEIAAGLPIKESQADIKIDGAAIEVRLCAEMPEKNFMPSVGLIKKLQWPQQYNVRVDTGYHTGDKLTPFYDSLLAKIIVHNKDRASVIADLQKAMNTLYIEGVETNQHWLANIIHEQVFLDKQLATHYLDQYVPSDPVALPKWLAPALVAIYQAQYIPNNNAWYKTKDKHTFIYYEEQHKKKIHIIGNNTNNFAVYDKKTSLGDVKLAHIEKNNISVIFNQLELNAVIIESESNYHIRIQNDFVVLSKYPAHSLDDYSEHSGELMAPLPGSIVKLLVKQGDQVNKGDKLIIMEAMKMEHVIKAPIAGEINYIIASDEANVSLGALLVKIT